MKNIKVENRIINSIRRIYIPLILIIFIVNIAKAQPIQLGITGGLDISSHLKNFHFQSGDINMDLMPKAAIGFRAGIIARKKLSKSLRLITEPSVILMGARYDQPFTFRGFDFQTKSSTDLTYIQLPILLQLSTVPTRHTGYTYYGFQPATTTYHLTGGIFGGYLLDAKFSGHITGAPIGISFEDDFSNNVTSRFPNYDGGIIFGGGFEHGHRRKIGFETRALYSFFNSDNDTNSSSVNVQNIAITFSLYFML